MAQRIGRNTIILNSRPCIKAYGCAVGKKEGEGPLKDYFDKIYTDEFCNEESFEKAETHLQKSAINTALKKGKLSKSEIDVCFAGDLLNQCIGSSFCMRDLKMNYAGLYGACSTMALSIALAGITVESGCAKNALAVTSSHFCSAERQYRMPLEYGGQRSPAAQWTVTGSGAVIVSGDKAHICIDKIQLGSVRDLNITDTNNMGAAMAPAAAQTIGRFLADTNTCPTDYDCILTGDLGKIGSSLLLELMRLEYNIDIESVHKDCGTLIFDTEAQDVHSGGSGCGCSACVLCSYIFDKMMDRELNKVLFVGTGALLSPTSSLQKESVPGVAHAVLFLNE